VRTIAATIDCWVLGSFTSTWRRLHPAALPARPGKDLGDGSLESQERVADDELDTGETTASKTLQELGPEGRVLGVADGDPEQSTTDILSDTGGDDDSATNDASTHAGRDIGGVAEQVGKTQVRQGTRAKGDHLLVQLRADPRHLGLGDAGANAERITRSSTLRVETPWT
jgi:hypothetical protein